MKESKDLPKKLLNFIPWDCSSHSIWLGTSLSLRRNISHFLFPQKMKKNEALQVRSLIKDALSALPCMKDFSFYASENINPTDKQLFFETFHGLSSSYTSSASEGIMLDESYKFIITLNMQDHLHLRIEDFDGEWEESFKKLMQTDDAIASVLSYAFLDKFGYLTASPFHCGTGFEAMFYLHLPLVLRDKKEALYDKEIPESVKLESLQGETDEFLGDIVILKNAFSLGVNETLALQSMFSTAMKFVIAEEALRNEYKKAIPTDIKDIISRSVGILQHSYQLKTTEAINSLSLLKLGLDLGFVKGTDQKKLNELFFLSQRAHLSSQLGIDVGDEKRLTQERAALLQKQLQSVQHLA